MWPGWNWACARAYHAADAEPLTGEEIGAIAEADLPGTRFAAAPAAQLLPSPYPAASIWLANMTGAPQGQGAETALITRPGFDPVVDALTPENAAIAEALLGGKTLALAAELGDVGPVLGLLLQRQALVKG